MQLPLLYRIQFLTEILNYLHFVTTYTYLLFYSTAEIQLGTKNNVITCDDPDTVTHYMCGIRSDVINAIRQILDDMLSQ